MWICVRNITATDLSWSLQLLIPGWEEKKMSPCPKENISIPKSSAGCIKTDSGTASSPFRKDWGEIYQGWKCREGPSPRAPGSFSKQRGKKRFWTVAILKLNCWRTSLVFHSVLNSLLAKCLIFLSLIRRLYLKAIALNRECCRIHIIKHPIQSSVIIRVACL